MSRRRNSRLYLACLGVLASSSPTMATPVVQSLSDSHGQYYLVNNGALSNFQIYSTGSLAGKITSIDYNGQQMVGGKDFYYDIQGTPGIFLGSGETYSFRTGSNFVDISAFHPATASEPLDVTWHFILRDGESAFSTYLTYHHTTAMANYSSQENRVGAQFFNGNLFHYTSVTDNFWGYQSAGDADRNQGRFVTAETSDMKGIPSEYIKAYETKYDWRSTYQQSGGVTGIVTAANTSAATGPIVANDYGAWTIENYRGYESWNSGPTHPQTPVADGASIIPSPAGSHFGGPGLLYTGNMDKAFGPIVTYFNKGKDINSLRTDAEKYTVGAGSTDLNNFYDSLNLPYYPTTAQRGTVNGQVRLSDGTSLDGATVILSAFDPTAYAADPLGQEYQRRAAGYNYWVSPNKDGTYSLPDVRPGNYRLTVIKPGYYREATYDNITVAGGGTTSVPNVTFVPDISGKAAFQIGKFDRSAGEFKSGNQYNNWIDTFNYAKEFPGGVNYTVNPSNPTNDTQNWANNWGLNQINGSADFWNVNFNLPSAPAANSTVTLTVAVADEQFINDLAALIGNNRVDTSFDHTADNAPATFRSGDTSSRVLYRKMIVPASWLHSGNNTVTFHIVGGNMQWDAVRMDIQNPGTFSAAQWNGGTGNWSDSTQWMTQKYGYTAINKGTAGIANDTSTTFADGATQTAPINNNASQFYYDAVINGGTINLNTSPQVQKLSLLAGTLNIPSGPQTLTANDAFVWAGATISGNGTVNALTTTYINFDNIAAGGATVNSSGAVTWADGGTVSLDGMGTQWNTPGLSFGQGGASTLSIASGATVSTGAGTLMVGSQGSVSITGGTLNTVGINNAGTFIATGAIALGTGSFINTGAASINGGLTGASIINNGGSFILAGTNTYSGNTTINGGVVQFADNSSIGGSGTSVTVNSGGAVSFLQGITDATFLSRIDPASTGAFALTGADAATDLDFTSALLSPFGNMGIGAVGNVTYTGVYTPSGNTYLLGGGGGTLTFSPVIGGSANVTIGNTGSTGAVILNAANSYSGTTAILGGVLSIPTLGNGLANSPLGSSSNAAGNLIIDGGTLSVTGPASTDRLFTIGAGGATLDGSGGAMSWTNTGVLAASGIGNRTLTLTGSNSANTFSPAVVDPSSGITALTKDGLGTWTLTSAAHAYSGDTTVLNGTLKLAAGASLPSGAGKGNLVIALGSTLEMNGQNLAINSLDDGPAPATGAGPNGNGGGTLDNNSGIHTLSIGNNNAGGQFSGLLSGGINLIKNGTGTEIISGDNTYIGSTVINAGTIQIGVGGTPLTTGPGDGGFRGKLGAGNIVDNATLVFDRGYLTTVPNTISGTGAVKQIANAELVLSGPNSYTGPTVIGDGIANIGQGGAAETGPAYTGDCSLNAAVLANGGALSSIGASSNAASNLILDGGTLYYSSGIASSTDRLFTVTQNGGAIYASGQLTFNNPGAIVMSGVGDRTLSLGGDTGAVCTFDSSIGDPAGGKTSLTKDRSATWLINSSASLTYSGDTNVLMGTLRLGTGAAIPFGAGKGNLVFGTTTDFNSSFPAVLDMNGNDVSVNGLSGGVPNSTYSKVTNGIGTHTLAIGNNNASATFNGIITGGINLTKVGAGTETLTGTSTYTGATTVNGGGLVVSNANAISSNRPLANNGTVTVLAGTTAGPVLVSTVSGTGSLLVGNASGAIGFLRLAANSGADTQASVRVNTGSTLDVTNNKLVINYGSAADPVAAILANLTSGYNGGLWTGVGIASSSAAVNPGNFTVGYADGTTDAGFQGNSVSGNQLIVKYTIAGDANLDGKVDLSDLAVIAQRYNTTGNDYAHGNLVYAANGLVGLADLALIAQHYNQSLGFNQDLSGQGFNSGFVADWALALSMAHNTAVTPEPGSLALAACMAGGLMARRRRNKRN